jgi:tetratricopeptide (TPR) repeat protein
VALAGLALSGDGAPAPVTLDQGIAAARQAVQRSRLDVEAKLVLAALLQRRGAAGDADEAVRLLQEAVSLRQPAQAPAVYVALGRVFWSRGLQAEAEAVYRAVADAFPLLPPPATDAAAVSEAHLVLGNLAAGRGDRLTAAHEYRLGLAADPGNAAGHFNLGVLYLELGDAAAARVYLQQALAVGPDLAVGRYYLGLALAMSGDTAGARDEWRRALQLDPACDACRQELQRSGGP